MWCIYIYIYIYICKDSFPFLSGFRVLLGLGFLVLFVFFFFFFLGTGINVIYIYMSSDSLPPKYTTFHHIVYVARWSPTLVYFKKIKKLKKLWGTTLPHRQGGKKLYI
jgi:hypothetical protein